MRQNFHNLLLECVHFSFFKRRRIRANVSCRNKRIWRDFQVFILHIYGLCFIVNIHFIYRTAMYHSQFTSSRSLKCEWMVKYTRIQEVMQKREIMINLLCCVRVKDLQAFDLVKCWIFLCVIFHYNLIKKNISLYAHPLRNISFNTLFYLSFTPIPALQIRQTALRLVRRIFDYIRFICLQFLCTNTTTLSSHFNRTLLCKSRVKKNLETQRERPWHWKLFSHKNQPPRREWQLFSQR